MAAQDSFTDITRKRRRIQPTHLEDEAPPPKKQCQRASQSAQIDSTQQPGGKSEKRTSNNHEEPPLNHLDESFVSKDLRLAFMSQAKGFAVVARRKLPANSSLRYGGISISLHEKNALKQFAANNKPCNWAEYIAEADEKTFEDAHPRHRRKLANKYGGRVNEPSAGEQANMLLISKHTSAGGSHVELITVEEVQAGTELTVHYGEDFKRNYEVGEPAKQPEWLLLES